MRKIQNILSLILLSIILSSCGLSKVIYSTKKVEKLDKVAVISSYIEFIPATGLLYAGIMNGKINSISTELNTMFKDYATLYRDSLSIFLSKNFNGKVLYGKSLQSNPGFIKLKSELNYPNVLATGRESFPEILQSSEDINPFKSIDAFKRTKPDTALISQNKKAIQKICKYLDVNYVVVSYSALAAVQGNAYVRGTVVLGTTFSLFDKDGDYIAWGYRGGGGTPISAGKIENYTKILDSFFVITQPLVSEVVKKYSLN